MGNADTKTNRARNVPFLSSLLIFVVLLQREIKGEKIARINLVPKKKLTSR